MGDNVLRHCYDGMWGMSADQDGDWVSYYDYKELLEKFNKALIELERLNRKNNIKYFDWR